MSCLAGEGIDARVRSQDRGLDPLLDLFAGVPMRHADAPDPARFLVDVDHPCPTVFLIADGSEREERLLPRP